ncbi:RNA polymerase sigma factor [Puia dinghuensis]|uniref:RNA polymerase sigma-70 factor n=1 Tax=Puia dinghuensis TaxID=1792502 RepID=A0A8J2XX46_9BACT|nr:sigma-70 family RNA polymerase sigma factor [Puia dinghuensis]GGB23959.1 RNA polymerase sigma-70 factor [Puia dinghuensis]
MKTTTQGDDWFLLFREGDKNAFREVFERYYRPISYFALKILRDNTYAEDIVSETFRKAWDRKDKFATPRHLENFLYLVTRNACISYLRGDRVNQSTTREWIRMAEDNERADSSIDLERVQTKLMEVIFQKLQGLPGGEVIRMSYLEGKSTREIASELRMTENNVYIIKSRSLKVLRTMLTKNEWMFFVLIFMQW